VGLALLANASMPLKFWDEAFLIATFLINLLPSKVINFDNPAQRLLRETPDYNSLRTFGCACWLNIRPYNNRKLCFRSIQCVFLRYSQFHKGFKRLEPKSGRVYISRDVVFDEFVFPFEKLHPNVGARLRKEILFVPDHLLNLECGGVDCNDLNDTNISNGANLTQENEETKELQPAAPHRDTEDPNT
jgi:hypothetical protein